jgi:N-methylhydantoinase A
MLLVGADVGGTFTDIVLTDTDHDKTLIHKVPSTPVDPSKAVLSGIKEICEQGNFALESIEHVFHGTTVATNAALQYRGARAGMITTRGFRDIIHIGRHQRPQHYSLQQEIPWQERPLVLRRYRKTVSERIAPPAGDVITPLDEDEVREAAVELEAAGVESITICFLFSYLNPAHEIRAKEIVQTACPSMFVSCSHEVAPQFREFERFTTAAMNAFVGPLVRDYVGRIAKGLAGAGFKGEVLIMQSNGGVAPVRTIVERPVYTLMSGLAAGVMGGAWVGRLVGRENIISLDIGGTSADIGVVTDGQFAEASARDTSVANYPILAPMIDLHTIGAGGGSIAYVDLAGAFKVGPESAGADPGPAAYGQGGTAATVTDANIVLGRLDATNFLGGAMKLDRDAAIAAVTRLADKLGLSLNEAAEGIIAILNANMANAIRVRTVQKGIDPRDYALVAAGGAGPLHGVEVARILDIPEVIVPPHPGINSAKGLLTTDLKYDQVRTSLLISTDIDTDAMNRGLEEMERTIRDQLVADEIDPDAVTIERSSDARYVGQGYELRLPLPNGAIQMDAIDTILGEFHALHEQEYGHHFPGSPIELVNLRVMAVATVPKIGTPEAPQGTSLEDAIVRQDTSIFREGDELRNFETTIYDRLKLPPDVLVAGPAIILQTDSTTVVPPGATATAQQNGCLLIKVRGDA